MTFLLPFFCLLKLPLLKLRLTVKTAPDLSRRCLINKGSSRSFKAVAHMKMKSTIFWQKMTPSSQTFAIPDVMQHGSHLLLTEELGWANNGCKLNEQSGY